MSIQDLGALGELVAAIATVATLIYLALQIRQNTRASSVEAKLTTINMLSGFTDMLIADPSLNELLNTARLSTKDLSRDDYQRFTNMAMKTFWFGSAAHYQLRHGTLTKDDWFEIESILKFWIEGPAVRDWWRKVGHTRFTGEYKRYVDDQMAKLDAENETKDA